jgi:hypothetical protein
MLKTSLALNSFTHRVNMCDICRPTTTSFMHHSVFQKSHCLIFLSNSKKIKIGFLKNGVFVDWFFLGGGVRQKCKNVPLCKTCICSECQY